MLNYTNKWTVDSILIQCLEGCKLPRDISKKIFGRRDFRLHPV